MSNSMRFAALPMLLILGACSSAPTSAELANRMLDAMGGGAALEAVDTIVLSGDGTRTRLGQIAETGGQDPMGTLTGVTETIDLANRRAAFDNDIVNGDFTQHRTEALTTLNGQIVGWGNTVGRPNMATTPNGLFSWATQNSPEFLLRRNVISIALAAAESASDAEIPQERMFNGFPSLAARGRIGDEDVDLFYDAETGLLNGFIALDTESMLGDVEADYIFEDYRRVGDLTLPHSVTILKEGRPYSSIRYTSIAINDPSGLGVLDVPADISGQAEEAIASDGSWSPIQWNTVAPGIYHAVAFSHHSMVVEFPTFVAVVEGPYTEAQSLTVARIIGEQIGKPIRYVAPTHPHYDHTGGIRGFASVGATVMAAAGHEAEIRRIVESPHTNPPDALATRRVAGDPVGAVEVFRAMTAITEGDRTLELYEVQGIPHVAPKVLAYVPGPGVLFQSDLFFGGPGPDAEGLYAAIRDLGINVTTIVGGHGSTNPYSDLVAAVGGE